VAKIKKLTFASNLNAMKKNLLFLAGLAFVLAACHRNDSLIGTWTVEKVNVQFDERHNTPELVKQIGEMEKQNVITISNDSTLTFKGLEETSQGRLSMKSDGTLLFDDTVFGQWKEGQIVTRTDSPLGEILVTYKKE
jgi:hypothetical protein